jgi:hypothetical protein
MIGTIEMIEMTGMIKTIETSGNQITEGNQTMVENLRMVRIMTGTIEMIEKTERNGNQIMEENQITVENLKTVAIRLAVNAIVNQLVAVSL